ncbi:unnamed protein product [Phytophthora fragariaefolia]|uniref:Unnamed protein product n=1 Tax=Phytophthora fragariaefolia TaxID=1490495 RepID=A0A9W6YA97_9STRA|nr:unnamed protein product [Phytophthora fragariaefolia]
MWALADSDRQSGVACVIYLSSPEPDGTCRWESVFRTDNCAIKYATTESMQSVILKSDSSCMTSTTTLTKLLPDHRYKFRAAAINGDGQQTVSDAIAARTEGKAAAKRSNPTRLRGAVNAMRAFGAYGVD